MSMWTDLADIGHRLHYVNVRAWRTRVLEAGDGPVLLLLHGTGGHLEAWTRNMAALSAHHRVIAYDFPGHGYSTLATQDLEIDDYVSHLLGLLEALGTPRVALCGESLGGWVAARFAARHPDHVTSLVLNTPGGTMASPEVMDRIRALSQAAADEPTPEHIRTRLAWLMADPSSVTEELVASRSDIYGQPGFARSMHHILCLQRAQVRLRNLLTEQDLADIQVPTAVLWTSDDPSGPASAGIAMAKAIPRGTFHLVRGAGHWPQWEQPEEFNRLLLNTTASPGMEGQRV